MPFVAFGEWIAWQSSPSEKSLKKKRPGIEPVRPGAADFPKEKSRFGKAAMYGILTPSVFTGVLHLYNINTKADLTLDTRHGDSEILLVSGTIAYYRVYDRLYKAEITTSGFGKPELIAKSDLVRDAHWAFLSGYAPASGK